MELWFSGVLGSNGLAAFTMIGSAALNEASDCVRACMLFFLIEGACVCWCMTTVDYLFPPTRLRGACSRAC